MQVEPLHGWAEFHHAEEQHKKNMRQREITGEPLSKDAKINHMRVLNWIKQMKMKRLAVTFVALIISLASFGQNYNIIPMTTSIGLLTPSGQFNYYPVGSIFLQYSRDSQKVQLINIYDKENAIMSVPDSIIHFYTASFHFVTKASLDSFYNVAMISQGGGGGGGVSSVAFALSSLGWLTRSGSPITSSGTITLSPTGAQTQNMFVATPYAANGAVALRLIGINDLNFVVTSMASPSTSTIPTTSAVNGALASYQPYSDTSNARWLSRSTFNTLISSYAPLVSPSLVTPSLGVASATSINKYIFTTPLSSCTVTIADGKMFTCSNTFGVIATDGVVMTTPSTSFVAARRDGNNTFTGVQTFSVPPVYQWAGTAYGLLYTTGGTGGLLQLGVGTNGQVLQGVTGSAPIWSQLDAGSQLTGTLTPSNGGTGTNVSTPISYSVSATIIGFSSTTVTCLQYIKTGALITLHFNISGTSNVNTLSFTLPFTPSAITGSPTVRYNVIGVNAGTYVNGVIIITEDGSSSNANFLTTATGSLTGWTATGWKQICGTIQYFTSQ